MGLPSRKAAVQTAIKIMLFASLEKQGCMMSTKKSQSLKR